MSLANPYILNHQASWQAYILRQGKAARSEASELEGELRALSELSLLTALNQTFTMYHTSLSGILPSELSSLTVLQAMGFNRTSLIGSIPSLYGELIRLTTLNLHTSSISERCTAAEGTAPQAPAAMPAHHPRCSASLGRAHVTYL